MFSIDKGDAGEVRLAGRLDAAQCARAEAVMDELQSASVLDFTELEYISSAGLGILLKTQKRLSERGAGLKIINVNKHIYDVFRYSGFHTIFDIEAR